MSSHLRHLSDETRRWLWVTFVYDRLWQPANLAQRAWVKTRGYPLPKWLIPPFRVDGQRFTDDWHLSASYWTPIGQVLQAWRMHRRGGYVRLRVGR